MRAIVAAVAGALIVAACASDDDSPASPGEASATTAQAECEWPTWGQSTDRTFSYPCETDLSPETVGELGLEWFFNADDVVTSTPAVVNGSVYVGDWAGTFYALDLDSGEERWRYQTEPHEGVWAGQIVSSPAVAEVDGEERVFFGGGKTLYALRTEDGDETWTHELGEPGNREEPTEIESSPLVVEGMVIFGFDTHTTPGYRAGIKALDAATGEEIWYFDPDLGGEPTGCVGVWSSPSVDAERRLVFAGSANCATSPEGWGPYTEAIFAVDLDTGEPVWSFQPHEPNNDDLDFAGSPNLFEADGRALVGLGNKDAAYYTLERETGELVWSTQATEPGIERPGSNFSTGGFIGPTVVADGVIAGGTAVGPCPCMHGLDAASGEILWQNSTPESTYAASAEAGGVVFVGANDFTFRAFDLRTGEILWSHEMQGVVAGGAAIVGNDVVAVAGIREPGSDAPSTTSGVYRFSLGAEGTGAPTPAPTLPPNTEPVYLEPNDQPCLDAPCELRFDLFPPPPSLSPSATLEIRSTPFSIRIEATGLGEPIDWVSPDSETFADGAELFGAYLSVSDDDPAGALVCVFDEDGICEGDLIPVRAPSFNRIAILAIPDPDFPLSPATGVPRLVTTFQFTPSLLVIDPPEGS